MAHMFCTVKQAAERLEISEADVEAMLDEGALREFRDGPNRLVKVSDMTALEAKLCPAGAGDARSARTHSSTPGRKRSSRTPGKTPTRPPRRRTEGRSHRIEQDEQNMDDSFILDPPASITYRRSSTAGPVPREPSAAERITLPLTPSAVVKTHSSQPALSKRPSSSTPPTGNRASSQRTKAVRTDHGRPAAGSPQPQQTVRAARKPNVRRTPSAPAAAPAPTFTPRRSRPQAQELSLREWVWMGLLDDRPHTILALLGAILLTACTAVGGVYLLMRVL